jgi:hypothetical protein
MLCLGAGSPTIILTSGGGDAISQFAGLLDPLAKRTLTCAYDRLGTGQSVPPTERRRTGVVLLDVGIRRGISARSFRDPSVGRTPNTSTGSTRIFGARGAPLAAWGPSARGRHRHRGLREREAAVGLAAPFLAQSPDDARGGHDLHEENPDGVVAEIESTLDGLVGG